MTTEAELAGACRERVSHGYLEVFREPGDPKQMAFDIIEACGPIMLEDVIGQVEQFVGVDDDGCIIPIEEEEVGLAVSDLVAEGRVVVPTATGDCFGYEDVLDLPDPAPWRTMAPLRVVELFAGIGAFRKALEDLRIPAEYTISEIDPFAVKSYNAIHGVTSNLGDITKLERLPPCDLLTYGFPCTDISKAGKQAGMAEGSGTRSSLLWEVKRLLATYPPALRPRTLIMENVAALVAKANKEHLDAWVGFLGSLGYVSTWRILDAPDYGVPQNRQRVIMVSQLLRPGETAFTWPKPTHDRQIVHLHSPGHETDFIRHVPASIDQDGPLSPVNREGIRKLSPTEFFLLMGFTVRDAYRAACVCSDAQLYKQAGNSIVVPVLEAVLAAIYLKGTDEARQGQQTLEAWL